MPSPSHTATLATWPNQGSRTKDGGVNDRSLIFRGHGASPASAHDTFHLDRHSYYTKSDRLNYLFTPTIVICEFYLSFGFHKKIKIKK